MTEKISKKTKDQNNVVALQVNHLYKKYRRKDDYAIKDVSFKVYTKTFHGFIGANGAGKTTTIKSIIGAYANFNGKINIFKHDNRKVEARSVVGYIPEAARFPVGFSAEEYLVYMAFLSGISRPQAKKLAHERIKKLGLEKLKHKSPNSYSSGQKKKILLAQALMHDPKIVIMDEPTANLDPEAREEFFEVLKDLKNQNKAVFISSHNLAELDRFVDAITILDKGKVLYSGGVDFLTTNHNLIYRLKTDQDSKIKTFLKREKIKYSYSDERNPVILAQMEKKENVLKVTAFISQNKISIETFKNNVISLDEVYQNYVTKKMAIPGQGVNNAA